MCGGIAIRILGIAFFVKGMPPFGDRRTHHVHVRPRADALPILTFRDQLRSHPEFARAYERLKRELAARFRTDREAYTHGKDAFISAVLSNADPPATERTVKLSKHRH